MIHPLASANSTRTLSRAVCYQIVAWDNTLPAFDPQVMVKTALLSPSSVKKFNRLVFKFNQPLQQYSVVVLGLRFATFAVSASVGRVLAPITAMLHIPPILIFAAGMRIDYMKIILRTFDFGFLFAASALWAVVFCAVLRDSRATLVVICWGNFISSLFQETNLRNTSFIVGVTLCEWLFLVMLMVWISLELVDDANHYTFITAQGGEMSTKDLLTNVLGTMATLSVRNLYQRYLHLKRHKNKSGKAMRAPGCRCKIALGLPGPLKTSIGIMLDQAGQPIRNPTKGFKRTKSSKRQLLQMRLAAESYRFDPTKTIWPRIGGLTPISVWKLGIIYGCGTVGGLFAVLSLFLPSNVYGADSAAEVIAVVALATSIFFTAVFTCCCQRQLLKRVMTSFHFLFLSMQILAACFCLIDMYTWRWVPASGITSGVLLAYCILTVDGLTPKMKQRLRLKYWIDVNGIILFLLVMLLLLLDVLVLGNWDLQDRVFLDFSLFGHRAQVRVAPFLLSRVLTIMVWSGRYVFVVLTRQDDNALILIRGNVEFDYEAWKKQATQNLQGKGSNEARTIAKQ